jgi:hypothetical protein
MPFGAPFRLLLVAPTVSVAFAAIVAVASAACHGGATGKGDAPQPAPSSSRPTAAPGPSGPSLVAAHVPSDGPPALQGSIAVPTRSIGLAIYAPQPIDPAVVRDTQETARQRFPGVNVLLMPMDAPLPQALIFAPDIGSFAPPTEQQIAYFGRGLDAAQRHAAAASKGVLILGWKLDADPTLDRLRDAQRLALEVAQKTGGTIWDETTGQLFGVLAWKRMRLDGWEGNIPDIRQHILIHYQGQAEPHRAVTVGMVKFGLPDLIVDDVLPSDAERMTNLVEAVAQLLVQGDTPGTSGAFGVNLKEIRHVAARTALMATTGKDAQLTGRVELVPTQARPGDPENRLVTLRFPYPGATEAQKVASAITAILGTAAR